MALIEGIGDDFITFLFIIFIIVIVIISWLSTNVRELSFPANLLVIERRSRRLYTTADLNHLVNNGNSNNNNNNSASFRSSTTTTTTTTLHHRTATVTTRTTVTRSSPNSNNNITNNNENHNNQTHVDSVDNNNRSNQITSLSLDRSHELELVNEIVEQALVDNLLDGDFYSSNDIELLNTSNHVNRVNSLPQTTTTTRLETNNLDVNSLDNHIGIQSANGDVASSINSKYVFYYY